MLPIQILERGGVINSKLTQTNFSRGRFQLQMLQGGNLAPNCERAQGFLLLDPNDPNGDCVLDFTPSCEEGNSDEDFDFLELVNVNSSMSDYEHLKSVSEQDCKNSCKEDCFYAIAIYNDNYCWKKQLPFINGRKGRGEISKVLVKFCKGELPRIPNKFPEGKKDKKTLITIILAVLGSSMFVNAVLVSVICLGFFLNHRKKVSNHYPGSKVVNSNMCHFTYQELVEATNVFKEELGKRAFGIVYKGVIEENVVAVKKLDKVFSDGEKEFLTEVYAIARTHHKNLVQLLGYCDEGEHRLLVYEYMCIGTLAIYLFGDEKPSWKQRSNIALGIAKGLAYLHEECSTQVIHCDIKPQNILLDEYYNAKISYFGLAKLLMTNESRTHTGIRGTKGYVAPEWFRNTPVTIKVDVYSFGVLLLEIISCHKSVTNSESGVEYGVILTDWAWDCYQEKDLDAFVENDPEVLDDFKKLITFVYNGGSVVCSRKSVSKANHPDA